LVPVSTVYSIRVDGGLRGTHLASDDGWQYASTRVGLDHGSVTCQRGRATGSI
jgi:hypothetical protein